MEIEAKFQIPDEQTFQRLLETDTLAGFTLGIVSITDLQDRYLDTKDWAIRAGGYAYRLRQAGSMTLATVKGLGGTSGAIHRREEYQVELPEPQPAQKWPPGTARDTMLRLCSAEELTALFEVKQTRHSRPLCDGDRLVAELSLDRVCVSRGNTTTSFLELEAELIADGREEDLEQLGTGLQVVWGLAPESRSKYDRGLALHDPEMTGPKTARRVQIAGQSPSTPAVEISMAGQVPTIIGKMLIDQPSPTSVESRRVERAQSPPERVRLLERPGVEADDPMSEAGRKVLRFHFRRMVYNEPGTRMGEDIEALHDMRVATRRMRAAFRVFGAHFEARAIKPYLKGLRRTGRALGAVRDLDVFRAKIQTYLDNLPTSQQGSLDDFLIAFEAQRGAARDRMNAYLDGKRYQRFVEQFAVFVETEELGSLPVALNSGEPRPYRVRHVAPMTIYQRLAAVRAYDDWVCVPDPPLARLHALRIACKGLRYTLESFREVLGPDTGILINEVVMIQDHLGALQDTVVASSILRDYLCRGTWGHDITPEHLSDPEEAVVAPGATAYLAAQQSEMQHLLDAFPGAWQMLKGESFSQLVADAVMVL